MLYVICGGGGGGVTIEVECVLLDLHVVALAVLVLDFLAVFGHVLLAQGNQGSVPEFVNWPQI
jgi:hypothetical protein